MKILPSQTCMLWTLLTLSVQLKCHLQIPLKIFGNCFGITWVTALNLSSPTKGPSLEIPNPGLVLIWKGKSGAARDKAFKASKKHGKIRDKRKFQRLKKEVQSDLRHSCWQHIDDIVTPQDTDRNEYSDMKRFWTFIKHQRSDCSNITPLKVNGRLITDSKIKAETLNHQFQSSHVKLISSPLLLIYVILLFRQVTSQHLVWRNCWKIWSLGKHPVLTTSVLES